MKKTLFTFLIAIFCFSFASNTFGATSLFDDGTGGNTVSTGGNLSPGGVTTLPTGQNLQPATLGSNNASNKLTVAGLISWFMGLMSYVIQFIIFLALVAFLYGIFKLVFLDASNEGERAKARKFMIWGICALFVMVSVWGLVNVLKSSLFGGGALILPQLK